LAGLYFNDKRHYDELFNRWRQHMPPHSIPGDEMAVENDIVLIHLEEKPLAFARIEAIRADGKPDWYQVKLLLLQLPLQSVTWILREAYIDGAVFTMNGKAMWLEKIACPPDDPPEDPSVDTEQPPSKDAPPARTPGKVIALADLKKKG